MQLERSFLLEVGLELTSRSESSTFMGFEQGELLALVDRAPAAFPGPLAVPPDDKPQPRQILKRMTEGNPRERAWAALELGRENTLRFIVPLLKRLRDADPMVRTCVLWALGKSCHPMVVPPLLEHRQREQDSRAIAQLAATLHHLLIVFPRQRIANRLEDDGQVSHITQEMNGVWTFELLMRRGKAYLKTGHLLHAVGDFTRAAALTHSNSSLAYMHRSQAFLFMGKPLFALDDLLLCPDGDSYPPVFHFHRSALLTLAEQIMTTARKRGLEPYAQLFQRRVDKLKEPGDSAR